MSTYTRVIAAAKEDAERFADEFPGQLLEGDWDSEAWTEIAQSLKLTNDECEELWPIYQDALATAIRHSNHDNQGN